LLHHRREFPNAFVKLLKTRKARGGAVAQRRRFLRVDPIACFKDRRFRKKR
jgi:hypothetical protein